MDAHPRQLRSHAEEAAIGKEFLARWRAGNRAEKLWWEYAGKPVAPSRQSFPFRDHRTCAEWTAA
jgi:hypothetical protein